MYRNNLHDGKTTTSETTRVQLILYYGIGRYLSSKKGKETWGTSVLETISSQLRKELPGLRGFSASSLKNMRQFYDNWAGRQHLP